MADLLLRILDQSLTLTNKLVPDEVTRIKKRMIAYRSAWDAEMAKTDRDNAELDRLDRELRDICELFLTASQSKSS